MTLLCYVDVETTGLDSRIHQPYEVAWWREDDSESVSSRLAHTLDHADPKALEVGGYFERGFHPFGDDERRLHQAAYLASAFRGVTLVGANPAFDAAMLTRFIGTPVWHYRLIDVEAVAMAVLGWDRPRSLANVVAELTDRGYPIPTADHTAEGDVRATRAAYEALLQIRTALADAA